MTTLRSARDRLACLVLGAWLAAGCALSEDNPPAIPPSPTALTATFTAESRTTSPGECPIPAGQPDLPVPGSGAAAADGILAFLNAGGTATDLGGKLEAMGLAGRPQDSTRVLDLNGDGWQDIVIALPGTPSTDVGAAVVLLCQGSQYVLGTPRVQGEAGLEPILYAEADLTGDLTADLLLGWRTCGAHTCQERLEVLSASGTRVARYSLDPSLDLPYPEISLQSDGSVAVTGTAIGSAGAGPFRRLTRTWTWDSASQVFHLASEELEPPRYRIHALLDADAAARRGDLQAALDLYHRVVLDESLQDWLDPETERANLTGYAMFRTVETYLRMHDEGDAQKAFGILQNQYPSGTVGEAYAAMAREFWDVYGEAGNATSSCQAAVAFAEAHAEEILAPLAFGYANPVYTAADVCPAEGL
jgi:hypothetical protein